MKRMHVLISDAAHAKGLHDDLIAAGIDKTHMHVLSGDHAALRAAGLPEPTPMEEAMIAGTPDTALISSIYATNPPSPKVRAHLDDLNKGKVMLVFAVDNDRVDEIIRLVHRHPGEVV